MQLKVDSTMIQWTISRLELIKIKKKAMRHKAWFKILDRTERAIIDLTIRCVEKIRSTKLIEIVTEIMNKLKQIIESPIKRLMRQIGLSLAQKLSEIAQRWGNNSAYLWVLDINFIQYLTIIQKNLSSIFRVKPDL
jgi:hypothetical protein